MSGTEADTTFLVALAGLPGMGPARLRHLLDGRSPADAWAVVRGASPVPPAVAKACGPKVAAVLAGWRAAAAAVDVDERWAAHDAAGILVTPTSAPGVPACLAADLEPPAVLFHTAPLSRLEGPRVAIVGTRRATRYGLDVARELGRDLAASGVLVVSGLATGIDGAAHRGALEAGVAPPVAVVGCGPDVVYPPRHAALWADVIAAGVLLSEHPLGTPPAPWRFPARNRVVAALADVLVVVESRASGGSLYTVDEALARDVPVHAVPGSVRSPASVGTNQLLADGAAPCRDAGDVLDALGLVRPASGGGGQMPAPPPELAGILEALGWEPATFDDLQTGTALDPGVLAAGLTRLVAGGWLQRQGGWFERLQPDGPRR